jgi:NAD(P)-dependent dehydrogenase (short-subunit alcohol dehydrogenase family)
MHGKVVLITGASSGIGLYTAAGLAAKGAKTVITARTEGKAKAALAKIGGDADWMPLDLSSLAAVREFAAEFARRYDRLDVLVNNAGAVYTERWTTADGIEGTLAVNHVGPFLLTNLLLDMLRASAPARIVNVASTSHKGARSFDFDDVMMEHGYRHMRAYSRSKLANILFTHELAKRLDPAVVTANSLHPGTVRTGFGADGDVTGWFALGLAIARPFMLSPEKGAKTSVWLASSPELEGVTGKYFIKCKPRTPSVGARDDEAARRLWDVTAKLAGV